MIFVKKMNTMKTMKIMKVIKKLILFNIIILLNSCNNHKEPITKEFIYNIAIDSAIKNFEYDSILDTMFIVRLETHENCLISEINGINIIDDKILIFDEKSGVCIFSLEGRFITKIGSVGRGPGEFVSITDIAISDTILYVCDGRVGKLHSYNLNNYKFIETNTLNHEGCDEIAIVGDYMFSKGGFVKTNLMSKKLSDKSNDIGNRVVQTKSNEFDLRTYNRILNSADEKFWTDPLRCEVYKLKDNGEIEPYLKMADDKSVLSESDLFKITDKAAIDDSRYITFFRDFYETKSHQVWNYSLNKERFDVLHDKLHNKTYATSGYFDYTQPFGDANGVYNDFFIYSISDINLNSCCLYYKNMIKDGEKYEPKYECFNVLEDINQDDNPILVFVRFK